MTHILALAVLSLVICRLGISRADLECSIREQEQKDESLREMVSLFVALLYFFFADLYYGSQQRIILSDLRYWVRTSNDDGLCGAGY